MTASLAAARVRSRGLLRAYRLPLLVALQLALVVAANYTAFWLRFDGDIPEVHQQIFINTIGWLVLLRAVTFLPFQLYSGLWQYTGLSDICNIIGAVASGSAVSYVIFHVILRLGYSRSILVVDALLLILSLSGVRLVTRLAWLRRRPRHKAHRSVIIYGAGDAGERIVRDMRGRPYGCAPLGFIDDDPAKVGRRIHGVPVLGGRTTLARMLAVSNLHEVLLAIPSAAPSTLQALVNFLEQFKVSISTLPSVRDILNGRVAVNQIRPLTMADLLPRLPIELEGDGVRRFIAGRSILVTGAGGSIGSELSRQIAALKPAALILLERYEPALYDLSNELVERFGTGIAISAVIGDVTDANRVDQVMAHYRPHIVFHAAAHKHVPLMEHHPCEAVKNNVVGTITVADAAHRWGAERFILISTDKAVNPSSVMGATKRVCELIVQLMSAQSPTMFATVRFGNVLGSNGSVLPRFLAQIKAGGPVTVTHPEIRRFFMLIPEAVQLVLHAAAQGEPGMTYVLEMGEQVRLVDLARNVIRLAGFVPDEEIAIRFIGLRPGEKLSEVLTADDETTEATAVPRLQRVRGQPIGDAQLLRAQLIELVRRAVGGHSAAVIQQLREILPTFAPIAGPRFATGSTDTAVAARASLQPTAAQVVL